MKLKILKVLKKVDLETKTHKSFFYATAIMLLSSLPYIHEFFFDENGNLLSWIPNLGIQNLIIKNNKFLSYSYYDVFLYILLIHIYLLIGALGWKTVDKRRSYHYALWLPLISIFYHIIIILFNARSTEWNSPNCKILGSFIILNILAILFYRKEELKNKIHFEHLNKINAIGNKIFSFKTICLWFLIYIISTFPYFHDLIFTKSGLLKNWVPVLGIESLLTLSDNSVWGFYNYKIFIYTLQIQIIGQIVWVGWFIDANYKLYRPFLLVPIILNLFEIVVIAIEWRVEHIALPGWKLALVLCSGFIIAILFFIKNKNVKIKKHEREKRTISNG